jgi:hypothetical protein
MLGISYLAEGMLTSQEGFCSVEQVSWTAPGGQSLASHSRFHMVFVVNRMTLE